MNKKKIITLAVVLAALIGVLVWVMNMPEKNNSGAEPDADQQSSAFTGEKIYAADVDSITDITFTIDGDSYTLQKDADTWICPQKTNVEVSQASVVSIMADLCAVSYTDLISDSSVTDEDCGIISQSDTISFDSDIGKVVLTLGNKVSDSELYYLKYSGSDDIYMVESEIIDSIFVPFQKIRNDSIWRIDYENVASIQLKNKNCELSIEKGEYNLDKGSYYGWNMISPIKAFARDDEVASKLINPVIKIEVSGYVNDNGDFASYGLSDKSNYISFTDTEGKSQTIYFSDKINNSCYFCLDSDSVIYEMPASMATFAEVSVIDVCDRQVYLTKQTNLQSIKIEGEGIKYEIAFDDESNISINGGKTKSKSESTELFTSLCGILADDVYTGSVGEASLTFVYTNKDASTVEVEYSDADDRYYYVSKNGEPMYKILKSKVKSVFEVLDNKKAG